ncbi:MAG: YoaK family protein [Candidatus Nitrosopolaris sp.]
MIVSLEQSKLNQTLIMRNTPVVVLAFTSGFVDAVAFLRLGVFASVLTGNTILVALAIDSGNILHAAVLLLAILGYISGVTIGARIANPTPAPEKIWPSAITKALLIEFLGLLLLATAGFFATAKPSGPFWLSQWFDSPSDRYCQTQWGAVEMQKLSTWVVPSNLRYTSVDEQFNTCDKTTVIRSEGRDSSRVVGTSNSEKTLAVDPNFELV